MQYNQKMIKLIRCLYFSLFTIVLFGCNSKTSEKLTECEQVNRRLEINIISNLTDNNGSHETLINVDDLKKIFHDEGINSFVISSNSIQTSLVDISVPQSLGYNDKCQEFRWLFSSWRE
jgi:hypothetical protein